MASEAALTAEAAAGWLPAGEEAAVVVFCGLHAASMAAIDRATIGLVFMTITLESFH